MAVDVKTLRIGSHVLMNGVRAKVMKLNSVKLSEVMTFHILVRGVSPDTGSVGECGCFADDKAVQPIPITPELLEEIGLVKEAPNIVKRVDDYFIYFHYLHDDLWCIGMYDDTYNYGNCIVRYLHEAEAFLALHGVELIKE